ncbi:putative gustatory receptor 58b [Drosophila eugracilis]|uniref:putative gustatory receptor 58b n=1 Tax=Drosophila eugracilis TaxID=29029 RepID=UPI0007E805A0|nr:putative gustatory receptor 58b [Drosophila eugracilis]
MLHSKLCRVMSLVYYHSVFFALMGTTLRIRSYRKSIRLEKASRSYLIYNFCVGIFLFWNIYYMVPQALVDGYIKYNIVLQWNFFVMIILRILAVLGCYVTIWLKRKEIIQLYKNSLAYWKIFRKIIQVLVNKEDLEELQITLARMMYRQIIVLYVGFMFSSTIQYRLLSVINKQSLLALSARLTHFLHFIAVKIGFYGMLLLLNHQFLVIQLALNNLHQKKSGKKWKTLRSIASMHLETLQLARRIFSLYDIINTTVFINMFMSTINILYHAVQFSNNTIKSDRWDILFGNGLIVSNIWGTLMLMNMLDRVVTSCNNIGQTLRQFSDLPNVSKKLQRELEVFTIQLNRNHLVYKICGIVKLDKPAGLRYIASILSNVIILMQFDLRKQPQPNIHHRYQA